LLSRHKFSNQDESEITAVLFIFYFLDCSCSIPPRVTIVVAFLETKNMGAAMKDSSGTLWTIIQGPGSSSAVAA
jgi:hypothetical protein